MLFQRFVTQPYGGAEYRSLLVDAMTHATFTHLDVAVAYATMPGVRTMREAVEGVPGGVWNSLKKRWLVGIDYYRSQPTALDALAGLSHSRLKVPDGLAVLGQQRCTPLVSYHPKTFIFTGPKSIAVISGSGNLSQFGLKAGQEVGSVLLVAKPAGTQERELWKSLQGVKAWYDSKWPQADSFARVRDEYKRQYESIDNLNAPTPTEDDATTSMHASRVGRAMGFDARQLRQLRVAGSLWIEAGNVTKNRGKDKPGNQLMLRRMTRVFFDMPARDVPENTSIGEVSVRINGGTDHICSLRFSDNSMDVLTLPIPEENGLDAYDGETLLFERREDGTFDLSTLSSAGVQAARRRSRAVDGLFQMKGNREFGIY